MRKYKRTTKGENEHISGKMSSKRHTWVCHKTKGFHQFELVFPPYWSYWASNSFEHMSSEFKSLYRDVKTPKEYYEADDRRQAKDKFNGIEKIFPRSRYWRCNQCGKQAFDSEVEPDKRIREHLI